MKKKSIKIFGHATSVSLEPEFWEVLQNIAHQKKISLTTLIANLDQNQSGSLKQNLASRLRLFVLSYYQDLTKR